MSDKNQQVYKHTLRNKAFMLEIYLLGTIHQDLEGPERLNTVIARLKPDIITVEAFPGDVDQTLSNHFRYLELV